MKRVALREQDNRYTGPDNRARPPVNERFGPEYNI